MSIHFPLRFVWDPEKSKANETVHGVSFAEAATRNCMRKISAEPYRDIDFSKAKRGPVRPLDSGKTKISIRLDNVVLDHFRGIVEGAGGGNYQSLINDALIAHIQQQSMLAAVRKVVRKEIARQIGGGMPAASRGGRGK